MPSAGEVVDAYANYYTHSRSSTGTVPGSWKRACQEVECNFLRRKHGYPFRKAGILEIGFGALCHSYRRQGTKTFLRHVLNGKLLDIGCGSGRYLSEMQQLGWIVQGVEFDPSAVALARENGLTVKCGSVEEQKYEANSFDAVTLNHVIEHVPDPGATLRECARILKPNGQILLFTPNSASLSHVFFGKHWRGLEPPRHLHIFSPLSMLRLLRNCGFSEPQINPEIASSVLRESWMVKFSSGNDLGSMKALMSACLFAKMFTLVEYFAIQINRDLADCLGIIARKQ